MSMFRPTPTTPLTIMPSQIESKLLIDALLVAIMLVWAFTIFGTLLAMAPNFPMTVWVQEKVIAVTRPSAETEEIIKPSEITRRKCAAWAKKTGKMVKQTSSSCQ